MVDCLGQEAWRVVAASRPAMADPNAGLLAYQHRAIRATIDHEVVVIEKSRRIGVTFAFASHAVLMASMRRGAGGMDFFYIGYNMEMTREFIDACAEWAKTFAIISQDIQEYIFKDQQEKNGKKIDESIQAFRIKFASGFQIIALPSRPRSLRGMQGFVLLDELAFHEEPKELLDAAMALLMWGGRVAVVSTHFGDENFFNSLIKDLRVGLRKGAVLKIDFDDAIMDGLYQRICQVKGLDWSPDAEAVWRDDIIAYYGEAAGQELYVIPASGSGSYLKPSLIQRQQVQDIPVIRWVAEPDFVDLPQEMREAEATRFCLGEIAPALSGLDPALMSVLGEDFALTGDLTVLWPAQIQRDMRRLPPCIIEMQRVPYAQQKQVLFYVMDRLPGLIGAALDATGNGAPLAQEAGQRYGSIVHQVKINPAWYRNIGTPFKAMFEERLTVLPADDRIYQDHRLLRLTRGVVEVPRVAKAGVTGQRHGDSAVAHMMMIYASLSPYQEISGMTARDLRATGWRDDGDDDDDVHGKFGAGAY